MNEFRVCGVNSDRELILDCPNLATIVRLASPILCRIGDVVRIEGSYLTKRQIFDFWTKPIAIESVVSPDISSDHCYVLITGKTLQAMEIVGENALVVFSNYNAAERFRVFFNKNTGQAVSVIAIDKVVEFCEKNRYLFAVDSDVDTGNVLLARSTDGFRLALDERKHSFKEMGFQREYAEKVTKS